MKTFVKPMTIARKKKPPTNALTVLRKTPQNR
jgi:hypothetical protein